MIFQRPRGFIPTLLLLLPLLPLSAATGNDMVPDSLVRAAESAPSGSAQRAYALLALGKAHLRDKPQEALSPAMEALQIGDKLDNDTLRFKGHLLAGSVCAQTDRLIEAMDHFLNAQEIGRDKDGKEWARLRSMNGINISGVYWMQKEHEKAIAFSRTLLPDILYTEDSTALANWNQSMGLFFIELNLIDSVERYILRATELHQALGNERDRRACVRSLGKSYSRVGRHQDAVRVLEPLLKEVRDTKDTFSLRLILPPLGNSLLELGRQEAALSAAREYMALAPYFSSKGEELLGIELLYRIHVKAGKLDSALYYHERMYALNKAILQEDQSKRIDQLETTYKVREKERENAQLQARNRLARRNNILWASSTILFFLLFGASFILSRRLRRTNHELEELQAKAHETNGQLLSLINEKKHIIGLIAHDVRTPIYLIQMNARVLEKTLKTDPDALAAISETRHAADQIHDAVIRIMEVENKHLGKEPFQTEVLDLRPTVERVCRDFRALADSKDLRITQTSFPKPLRVKADPFLLRHAVYNLLSNAIKFSPAGKKVGVRLEEDHHLALIHICDEGPGLTPEQIERIHSGTPSQIKESNKDLLSWGQGLYLTRKFLQEMGGALSVKSEPGKGSTFTITLPVAQELGVRS